VIKGKLRWLGHIQHRPTEGPWLSDGLTGGGKRGRGEEEDLK